MSADRDWQLAFLAVSSLLGEPLDVAASALDDSGAPEMAGPLGSTSRQVRAAAVARAATSLLAELQRATLA
jgi:hypothetical protein